MSCVHGLEIDTSKNQHYCKCDTSPQGPDRFMLDELWAHYHGSRLVYTLCSGCIKQFQAFYKKNRVIPCPLRCNSYFVLNKGREQIIPRGTGENYEPYSDPSTFVEIDVEDLGLDPANNVETKTYSTKVFDTRVQRHRTFNIH